MTSRRMFLERSGRWWSGMLAASTAATPANQAPELPRGPAPTLEKKLKIMMKSAWGSDDPTRASFPFLHGLALADAGHEVRIFLTGEATYLMRKATLDAIVPVGWPPLSDTREKIVAKRIRVFS